VNLLLFRSDERGADGLLRIGDQRLQHLLEVHGKDSGDSVRVGEIGGDMGSARILSIDNSCAVLEPHLDQPPPPKLPLVLVVALPRPKMLRRILRSVAELGVGELHLINSYRVEKSYWQTPVLQADTIRDYLLQGLEQSRDTQLPCVHLHKRFKPFVEDDLPGLINDRTALLAHPGEHPPCPRGVGDPTLLVIGPEGGFIPYEVEKLAHAGCQPVSLGPRILRVENAVTSLVGRLF
jgi:RsmE family RNA methyltransferase